MENKVEAVTNCIFLGSRITVDHDCSHEIKRHLFLDSVLKTRDIALLTKVCLVKVMVFPVVMYGCESWTIKKVEHLLLNCGVVRVPWTARSNQSILKEISPEYSLKGLMLKLKLQ